MESSSIPMVTGTKAIGWMIKDTVWAYFTVMRMAVLMKAGS